MRKQKAKNQKTSKDVEFEFLPDTPLRADQEQEIRFGHISIAENLKKIILKCPTPFTIGLFAKWGTGKTTIINLLGKKLRQTKIACVVFDVWKHEGDALRRTFLKEIVKQLKEKKCLSKRFKLSENLESKISREFQGKFRLRKPWFYLLLGLIVVAIIGGFLFGKFWTQALGTYLSIVIGGPIAAGFFTLILRQALTIETITSTTDQLQDPHEFETEFKKIVKNVHAEKLLVIIDNLDRASHRKAVELLTTIKTFLEQEKCVFLIACDDKAIKEHIENVYVKNSQKIGNQISLYADEFLRKFFNTSQRIPDFIDTELHTYSEDLLKETIIPQFDSPDVVSVITTAFRKNPRQIKQFINTLITEFLLAERRENDAPPTIIPKGAVTGNVAFLAKFLVICQQFPNIYKIIIDNHLSLDKIEEIDFKEQGGSKEKFQDFQRATSWIRADDIRPFHYLKQSDEERSIPRINELKIALLDNKEEIVKEQMGKMDTSQTKSCEKIVLTLMDENKTNRLYLGNIIFSCLIGLKHNHKTLTFTFYNKIAGFLNDDKSLRADLGKFEPTLIFEEILGRCNQRNRKGVIDRYVELLDRPEAPKSAKKFIDNDYAIKLLKEFIEHRRWLNDSQKEKIRQTIAKSYYSNKFLSLFTDDSEVQKDFISGKAISKFITTFSDEDIENKEISNNVEIIISLKDIITTKIVSETIAKFRDLVSTENSKSYRGQKENLVTCIEDILDSFYKEIGEITDYDTIDSFTNAYIQGMNALGNFTEKRIFIYTCYRLLDILKDPRKTQVNNLIADFFNSADVDSIKFVFDKLNIEAKQNLIQKHESTFRQRALQEQSIFDLLYPWTPKDIRTQWFTDLINANPQRAVAKLEELHYKPDNKVAVVNGLLEKAPESPIEEKENLYNVVNKMECAEDAGLRTLFGSQIKELLKNTDQNQQKCGYSALQKASYLPETLRRGITLGVIEWLRSLPSTDANQPYSIRSVLINWITLPLTPKRNFVDFLFEKLIKSKSVKLGFETLSQIKPRMKYKTYSRYFDDVFAQAENEPDKQIRVDIYDGLLLILPEEAQKIQTDKALSNARFALEEAKRNGWSDEKRKEFQKEVRTLIVQMTHEYGVDKNRFKNIRELLDRAIATDSSFSDFYHMKGLSYFWSEEYKEAVKWYEKAAELNPTYVCTWGDMITCLFRVKKFNDATEKIKLAISAKIDESNLRSELSKFKVSIDKIWPK